MHEVAEAAKIITSSADEDAKVIFGATIDDSLGDEVRITVVATGFDSRERRTSSPGAVEVQAQGSWSPNAFLRVREEENVMRATPRQKVNFQTQKQEPKRETYAPVNSPVPLRDVSNAPEISVRMPQNKHHKFLKHTRRRGNKFLPSFAKNDLDFFRFTHIH